MPTGWKAQVCPKSRLRRGRHTLKPLIRKCRLMISKKPLKTPRRKVSDLRKLTSRRVRLRLRSRKLTSRGIQLTLKAD